MSSNGRVAIVTGGGSGIGRHSALALLRDGYSVAIAGRRKEPLDETVELAGAGASILAVQADVGDPASVSALFAQNEGGVRPSGRAVQQRRLRGAQGAHGGPAVRGLAERGRYEPDGIFSLHAGSDQDHEGAGADGRADHQQRLDLGPRAAPRLGRLHGDQARGHPPDQVDFARRSQSTTSRAARSTSATPPRP